MKERNIFFHEAGRVCNIAADYERIIKNGLDFEREECTKLMQDCTNKEYIQLNSIVDTIDAILEFTQQYEDFASSQGLHNIAQTLHRVPRYGATTFLEALQFFRIIHFAMWGEGVYHNIVGRFDQYMYPYYEHDIEAGILSQEQAQQLLEEFFITFNIDSDLYPGVQQGDNGQSIMLGGIDSEGNDSFNKLSLMCLEASRKLLLIDPKINVRVNKNTPDEIFYESTKLTKVGLGFPQYSNDDVVIEGLLKRGYSLKDARDYTVAACWEFIIPKVGMDIPNIAAINFPKLLNNTIEQHLQDSKTYEEFYNKFCENLDDECRVQLKSTNNLYIIPSPIMSLMMSDCIERKLDISTGNKYNNYGFHGVGLATVIDSLAVIKKCIYSEKSLTKASALAIIRNTEPTQNLLTKLRYEQPKFGDNSELTNNVAIALFDSFSSSVKNLTNERGGCVRAGTGTAMYYLWHSENISNALSGHRAGENYPANYAPELFVKKIGPMSNIMSLSKPDFTNVINGGPLTIEFHSSVFNNEEGLEKVAKLVKQFVVNRGHQLQLNSVNVETMRKAQQFPEDYQNLIVRIWGWSAYFVELDKEFQDHVIQRQEYLF